MSFRSMVFRSMWYGSEVLLSLRWAFVLLIGLFAVNVAVAADVGAGKAAYAVCAACHGANGEGNIAMNAPKIAGQEGWYIKRQLAAYQAGTRGTASGDAFGMQMRPMAMTIAGPAAVDNLVAYIKTMPVAPSAATITGDVAAGKATYAICAACHGPAGEGNEQLGGPKLAGQNDWYLVRQMNNYNGGLRGYDSSDIFGMQMKPMAATVNSPEAINNVVAYINSLQ